MTWVSLTLIGWAALLVLAGWLAPRRWQPSAMAAVGLAFLGLTAPLSLLVLAGLGICGYLLARGSAGRTWRVLATAGLVIAAVVWFKRGTRLGSDDEGVAVPLGLAFYTLRIVHVSMESYGGRLAALRLADYARYLLFFPTIVAGPINRFPDFVRDTARRRWDSGLFAAGLERILYGFFKTVVLGNRMVSDKGGVWLSQFDPHCDWVIEYLRCLHYGANLYFQFAGYSDVAIGLALLVGYRIPENFNWPFLARNLGEFWKRWHMTLSGWCRDYVFSPVAAGTRNAYLGVLASMLVLGLWHELSPRYCVWGLYHGLGIAFLRGFQSLNARFLPRMPAAFRRMGTVFGWALTMNFVILGFAITRESTLADAWKALITILTLRSGDGV